MALAEWQTALRRQYGREAQYTLKNFGQEPVFSDFEVTNPDSQSTYRVAIRGSQRGTISARARQRGQAKGSVRVLYNIMLHPTFKRQVHHVLRERLRTGLDSSNTSVDDGSTAFQCD
jgi:hypothetical protein